MYSPPDLGMEPPSTPQTMGKPMPARTNEMRAAMMRLPPKKTPRPNVTANQMLGVSPWFMKPTAKASVIERPRTRPLALRAKASSSATFPPFAGTTSRRPGPCRRTRGRRWVTHENEDASADRLPFFSGFNRYLPLIDILELPRHHRKLGARDSRDLADDFVDEAQKLLGVARVHLDAEVAFADGSGHVADGRELHELRGDVLQLAGGDFDEHVADDGETHRLRVDDGADADHARAHQPLDAVAHGALGHVPDASCYLGRRDAAVFQKERHDLAVDRVETERQLDPPGLRPFREAISIPSVGKCQEPGALGRIRQSTKFARCRILHTSLRIRRRAGGCAVAQPVSC